MSNLNFLDSFSDRAKASMTKKMWTFKGSDTGEFDANGRFGNKCFVWSFAQGPGFDMGGSTTQGASGVSGQMGIGAAIKKSGPINSFNEQYLFRNTPVIASDGITISLHLSIDGRFIVKANGTVVAYSTAPHSLFLDVYYFIEWQLTVRESTVALTAHEIDVIVKVEGLEVMNVAGIAVGFPTGVTHYINISHVDFGPAMESGHQLSYSDFYFRLGTIFGIAARVLPLRPNGNGTYQQWSPAAYTNVDELLLDTSDYIEATGNDLIDTFTMEDIDLTITPAARIVRVGQYLAYVIGGQTDSYFVKHFLKQGAAEVVGTDSGTTDQYLLLYFEGDPFSATTLLASEVNSLEAGVKVTT